MRLVVTDEARNDLNQIERYSRRTWGDEQARAYRRLIIQLFGQLMARPTRGRREEKLAPGMRRANVRQHAVFYVVRGEDLVIARVLHQSRDIRPALFNSDV